MEKAGTEALELAGCGSDLNGRRAAKVSTERQQPHMGLSEANEWEVEIALLQSKAITPTLFRKTGRGADSMDV